MRATPQKDTKRKFDWRYKRVIVTGGSRGLGLVIARQLADQGARLTICSRDASDLEVAAEELRQRGGEVLAVPCDVREHVQVESLVDRVVNQLDAEINAAFSALQFSFNSMPRNSNPLQMRLRTDGGFSPIPPENTNLLIPPIAAA